MKYAPVLIPTLNRYEHLVRCIESLARCTHADKTTLYIALDYPAKQEHWDGYNKISKYLGTVSGFEKVEIISRKENYGPVRNNDEAQEYIYTLSSKIICGEDDTEFAPSFLDYVNKGLELFESDKRVSAICGFKHMITIPKEYPNNYYCDYSFNAWGYGTWKDRWDAQNWDMEPVQKCFRKPFKVLKIFKLYNTIPSYLMNMIKYNVVYGDAIWVFNNITYGAYSIYPTVPKLRNWGLDGSGVHCPALDNSTYNTVELDKELEFDFSDINVILDEAIHIQISNRAKRKFKTRLKYLLDYLLFLMHFGYRRTI